MVLQVNYRTDYGEILAAQAQETGSNENNSSINQSEVRVLRTAAGIDLLVAAMIGDVNQPDDRVNSVAVLREQIFLRCQESTEHDPVVILRDAIQAAIQAAKKHPRLSKMDLSMLVTAISGRRLFLAQFGQIQAYLLRGDRLITLTREQSQGNALLNIRKTLPVGISNRYEQDGTDVPWIRKRDIFVDTNVHLPGENPKDSLELQPRDGLIISMDRSIEKILRRGPDGHLPEDFLTIYDEQPPSIIADRLLQASSDEGGLNQKSLIVIKTNESLAAFPLPAVVRGGSCLSQIGIIGLILIISMVLGLAAAYAVPALMNPKPIPSTGSNLPAPSGFISILMADGLAQATIPGQGQVVMAPGAVLNAKPGTVVETTRGTAKLQMIDGSNIYVGNNTSLLFQKLADPKVNLLDTELLLSKGITILDASHSNKTTVNINTPSPNSVVINGLFVGVDYLPNVNQINVGCMEGECSIKTATGTQTLQTGQSITVTNGVIGSIAPLDMSIWQGLCDTECPALAPQDQPTPTQVPTDTPQPTPVPYLGQSDPTAVSPIVNINPAPVSSSGGAVNPDPVVVPLPSPSTTPGSQGVVPTISPPPPTGAPPPKALRARILPILMVAIMAMGTGRVRGAARIQKRETNNSGEWF